MRSGCVHDGNSAFVAQHLIRNKGGDVSQGNGYNSTPSIARARKLKQGCRYWVVTLVLINSLDEREVLDL